MLHTGLADTSNAIEFDAEIVNMVDQSAADWYDTEYTRCFLTALLLVDLGSQTELNASEALNHNTYVGREGMILLIGTVIEDEVVMITYVPAMSKAHYMQSDGLGSDTLNELLITSVLESNCSDGYKKNDVLVMREVLTDLHDAISN